jgi:hypothetical protein
MKKITYTTINQAFENGTGDVCFSLNNEYLFVSRKSEMAIFEELKHLGFVFIPYEDVLRIGRNELRNK